MLEYPPYGPKSASKKKDSFSKLDDFLSNHFRMEVNANDFFPDVSLPINYWTWTWSKLFLSRSDKNFYHYSTEDKAIILEEREPVSQFPIKTS